MLIGVHVIIIAHIVQWLVMGTTLSPVEPSESMSTLELGAVNAGFVFFLLAIVSTIIFGRFLCGWGCHVVALQDLCSWLMTRAGIRPKPFRSRLLVWVPLVFGLYMFVWPTFKREALLPAMAAVGVERPIWLRPVAEFRGFHDGLMVQDFWASFPPWYVAIPFFGVVGFAAVYFLGSKGFCTYGCPYGGIFGVADKVSPGRIVVSDACEGCGHCTAVCTSNVRVHEEVRDFGMVVDPGCMKCLDCVSACPKEALSFGFAKPSALAKPRDTAAAERVARRRASTKRFDLTQREEWAVAVVFIALFLAYRGFLNHVPMLMAIGMAGVGAFLLWKCWSLLTRPSVRVQNLQLKAQGRWFVSGWLFAAIGVLTAASAAWGGTVTLQRWLGHLDHERIRVPLAVTLRPEFVPAPEVARFASRGLERIERSRPIRDGGIGWALRPSDLRETAFLRLVMGDPESAAADLQRLIERGTPTDEIVQHLGSLLIASGATREEVIDAYQRTLERHPALPLVRSDLARLRIGGGMPPAEAVADWEQRLEDRRVRPVERLAAAELFASLGMAARARDLVAAIDEQRLKSGEELFLAGRLRTRLGDADDAARLLERAARSNGSSAGVIRSAITLLMQTGQETLAVDLIAEAVDDLPSSIGLRELAGSISLARGDTDAALRCYQEAMALVADDPWGMASLGEGVVRAGLSARNLAVAEFGLEVLQAAEVARPGSPTIRHDVGQAQLALGRFDEGLARLASAAADAPDNAALQSRYEQAVARVGAVRGE